MAGQYVRLYKWKQKHTKFLMSFGFSHKYLYCALFIFLFQILYEIYPFPTQVRSCFVFENNTDETLLIVLCKDLVLIELFPYGNEIYGIYVSLSRGLLQYMLHRVIY